MSNDTGIFWLIGIVVAALIFISDAQLFEKIKLIMFENLIFTLIALVMIVYFISTKK